MNKENTSTTTPPVVVTEKKCRLLKSRCLVPEEMRNSTKEKKKTPYRQWAALSYKKEKSLKSCHNVGIEEKEIKAKKNVLTSHFQVKFFTKVILSEIREFKHLDDLEKISGGWL